MAYVFDQINGLMDKNKTDSGSSLNLIDQSMAGTTSPESSVPGGFSPSPDPTASSQARENGKVRAASAAQAHAQGNPGFLKTAEQNIGQASSAVQNEADKYVQGVKNLNPYAVSQGDIATATGPTQNQGSYQKISSLLGTQQAGNVTPFVPQTNTAVYNGEYATNSGLQNALRQENGPAYTPGTAAFDAQALRSNPQFNQTLALLDSRQKALNATAQALPGQATESAQGVRNQQLTDAKTAATKGLGDLQQGITDAEQAAADKANQALDANRNNADYVKQYADPAYQDALKNADPALEQYLPQIQGEVSPSQYLQFSQPYMAQQFVNPQQAAQFNQISSLLGKTDAQQAYQGQLPSGSNFNATDYEQALIDKARQAQAFQASKPSGPPEAPQEPIAPQPLPDPAVPPIFDGLPDPGGIGSVGAESSGSRPAEALIKNAVGDAFQSQVVGASPTWNAGEPSDPLSNLGAFRKLAKVLKL